MENVIIIKEYLKDKEYYTEKIKLIIVPFIFIILSLFLIFIIVLFSVFNKVNSKTVLEIGKNGVVSTGTTTFF
jgi:biopolymer transport protein ExbD